MIYTQASTFLHRNCQIYVCVYEQIQSFIRPQKTLKIYTYIILWFAIHTCAHVYTYINQKTEYLLVLKDICALAQDHTYCGALEVQSTKLCCKCFKGWGRFKPKDTCQC